MMRRTFNPSMHVWTGAAREPESGCADCSSVPDRGKPNLVFKVFKERLAQGVDTRMRSL